MRHHAAGRFAAVIVLVLSLIFTGCGASFIEEDSSAKEESQSAEASTAEETKQESEAPASQEEAVPAENAEESAAQEEPAQENAAEEAAGEEALDPVGGKALNVVIGTSSIFEMDDEGMPIATVTYPTVMLTEGDEIRYAELENTLEAKNEAFKRNGEQSFEYLKSILEGADVSNETPGGYTDEVMMHLVRADEQILSLCGDGWQFTGGAHGIRFYRSANFDTETGRELAFRDIAKDPVVLMDRIKEIVIKDYPEAEGTFTDSADMVSEGIADSFAWTMGYDAFTMWFGSGEITPSAAGSFNVAIPYAGNEDLFNEKYLTPAEQYGYELVDNATELDVDKDGDLEHLEFYPNSWDEEYGRITEMNIDLDGNILTDSDVDAFDFSAYIVRTAGKTLLYAQYTYDNDSRGITVYDLSSGTPTEVGSVQNSIHSYYDEEAGCIYRYVLSDPEHAIMGTPSPTGAGTEYAAVTIGEDGLPQ